MKKLLALIALVLLMTACVPTTASPDRTPMATHSSPTATPTETATATPTATQTPKPTPTLVPVDFGEWAGFMQQEGWDPASKGSRETGHHWTVVNDETRATTGILKFENLEILGWSYASWLDIDGETQTGLVPYVWYSREKGIFYFPGTSAVIERSKYGVYFKEELFVRGQMKLFMGPKIEKDSGMSVWVSSETLDTLTEVDFFTQVWAKLDLAEFIRTAKPAPYPPLPYPRVKKCPSFPNLEVLCRKDVEQLLFYCSLAILWGVINTTRTLKPGLCGVGGGIDCSGWLGLAFYQFPNSTAEICRPK